MKINLKPNELVIKAADTNHYYNCHEQIQGKLILTNQRLYFKTHDQGINKFDMEILPTQIKEVIYFKTKKIFPNGLNIITKDGKELRFVLKKRNSWGEMINKMY